GAPAGCSRCERSLDTPSACVASSRVVPLTCAPLPPSPRLSASDDNDANTAYEIRDRNAPQSAPLPPGGWPTSAGCPSGCPTHSRSLRMSGWRVPQLFADTTHTEGAPSFAAFCEGWARRSDRTMGPRPTSRGFGTKLLPRRVAGVPQVTSG